MSFIWKPYHTFDHVFDHLWTFSSSSIIFLDMIENKIVHYIVIINLHSGIIMFVSSLFLY